MPSNSTQRELLVDALDDQVAYAYAYYYQARKNNHLELLKQMGQEVESEAKHSPILASLPLRDRLGICHETMNGLRHLVRNPEPSEEPRSEWLNAPHTKQFLALVETWSTTLESWNVIQGICVYLEKIIPSSIRSITTRDQVLTLTKDHLRGAPLLIPAPLHLPSIAEAVHTVFVSRYRNQITEEEAAHQQRSVLSLYLRRARTACVGVIRAEFVTAMTSRLYERAKHLDIEIDRYYPWGALFQPPRRALEILADFAALVAGEKQWVTNWKVDKVSVDLPAISGEQYLKNAPNLSCRVVPRSSSGPIYFSSERSEITIDAVPLQNQLALVLPFDRPFRQLDQAIDRFVKYFEYRAAQHQAATGEPGAKEKLAVAALKRATPELKAERVIVDNVGSLYSQLAALRSLESDAPREPGKPQTSLYFNIHKEFASYGFALKPSTAQTAIQRAISNRDKVIRKLDSWVAA
ncbi:hypothetical protein E2553_24675 [Paraburkholderia dipogonis]|uniref:Uncharacterized protein n=1 Tax=Paraburkholderia dipogonis TaxID=1211383 RepID=A0A4Y8MR36_9BURK|nr:hypothetical protein [Paraburkholderia dipogonis]TFE39990.1 hypothetical protein E2553_24675 [Paraburkholderia dipogonis]